MVKKEGKISTLTILAFIGGILSIFFSLIPVLGVFFPIIIIVLAVKNPKLLLEFRKTQNFTKKMNKNCLLLAILSLVLTVLWLILFTIIPFFGGIYLYNYHVIGYGFVINLIGGGLVLISAILMNKIQGDPSGKT